MKSRNHLKPWLPADLKKMRALAKAKLSARLAAKELGRSTGATRYKAMTAGVHFRSFGQVSRQKQLARLRMKTGRMNVRLESRGAA
jgi:hypothetical protein